MSIFESEVVTIPTCEICQERACKRIDEERFKKRCEYCDDRYDGSGQPFIVYCEIDSFRHPTSPHKGDMVHFWLMGGIVVKCPDGFSGLLRKNRNTLLEGMKEMGYQEVVND